MNNETTASQPKSIGDDEQFRKLMLNFMNYATATLPLREQPEYRAIAEFLDNFRAPADQASATIYQVDMDNGNWGDTDKPHFDNFKGEKRIVYSSATIQAAPDVTRRKAFICTGCEGVYPDEPTTSCDCMVTPQRFVEGEIVYPIDATIQEPVMVAEPVGVAKMRAALVAAKGLFDECSMTKGPIIAMVDAALAAPMVADPAGVALDKLRVHYVEGLENGGYYLCTDVIRALAATVKAVPSDALELTELADAMQYWGGVFAHGFAEAGDAVRSRGYSDERWVNARSALEWMRNRLYKHGKMGHPDAHAKYGSPFPGAAPLADKTGGGE